MNLRLGRGGPIHKVDSRSQERHATDIALWIATCINPAALRANAGQTGNGL